MAKRLFPDDFRFGVMSSALQIEGAAEIGGRSPSIWDKFAAKPGVIVDGTTPEDAADHLERWQEDALLLKRIGIPNYNFSIAWPRVLPNGIGTMCDKGIDFYDRLVDGLLEQNVTPWVALNHRDLPLILEQEGGWVKRDMIYHFADYAQKVAARLADRVSHWITHNDPHAQAFLGYATGDHAPGETKPRSAWMASHHLLLAHAYAREALHSEAAGMEVGMALHLSPMVPASDSAADYRMTLERDGRENRWYLDALFKGEYPDDIYPLAKVESGTLGTDWIARGDLEMIKGSLDFLGVNYYRRTIVRSNEKGGVKQKPSEFIDKKHQTDVGYEVAPDNLTELLMLLQERYQPQSIYITENGAAYGDSPDGEGRVRDSRRAAFHSRHLEAVREAMAKGALVKGYFVRSFLDGFEWTQGYSKRYGMVWVDFETQERILKDSAHWYKRAIDTKDHDWAPNVDYRE